MIIDLARPLLPSEEDASVAQHGTEDEEDAGEQVGNQSIDAFRVWDLSSGRIKRVNQHKKQTNK